MLEDLKSLLYPSMKFSLYKTSVPIDYLVKDELQNEFPPPPSSPSFKIFIKQYLFAKP